MNIVEVSNMSTEERAPIESLGKVHAIIPMADMAKLRIEVPGCEAPQLYISKCPEEF